jgi:hypothetical protein
MGITTAYQGTSQLAIRNTAEANMNGTGCTIYIKKDFEDNSLTSGGWSQQSVLNGSILWTASSFGSDKFGKISGYLSGNTNSENWLISPAINLAASANPVLSFRTAAKFAGDQLNFGSQQLFFGAPSTATWTQLTGFALSPTTRVIMCNSSGSISLNAYKNANTRLRINIKSTTAGSTT